MKKYVSTILCTILMLLSGCTSEQETVVQMTTISTTSSITKIPSSEAENRYLRIDLSSETLGETLKNHVSVDTAVTITAKDAFPTQMPIYEIKERTISETEFQQMLTNLQISDTPTHDWCKLELENNKINGTLAPFNDPARGFFEDLQLTDEELEELAWETFNKIPFLEGEYLYVGKFSTMTEWSYADGECITRVGVRFSRMLDGVQITGSDRCELFFDGSGFVEMHLALYDYEQIGTMDMVPLEDAKARIKSPDCFSVDLVVSSKNVASTLVVDRIKLHLVNQYSRGCTILQPLYNFVGTATLESGSETRFSSRIIAIPESYTYEAE